MEKSILRLGIYISNLRIDLLKEPLSINHNTYKARDKVNVKQDILLKDKDRRGWSTRLRL